MTNISTHMNHFHLSGDVMVGAAFGPLISCRPVNIAGIGHQVHVEARFQHGARIELDRATAAEFARRLIESVSALPTDFGDADLSGAASNLGEDAG